MGNVFDFGLRADDKVSEAFQKIEEKVKSLEQKLEQSNDKIKRLSDPANQEGLSDIEKAFANLGKYAKQNVQFIGDMVPPLRNFTGMAGHIGGMIGRLGVVGGAAYLAGKGITSLGSDLNEASKNAYNLQVAAENAGMGVAEFSRMTGVMQLLGSKADDAQQSVEGLYKTFNDAAQGRNNTVLSLMNQIGAVISRNADGTANVTKTMESLASIIPTLAPQTQKTVADALGLDANGLQLLREGVRLKDLLTESDKVGLTVDPKTTADLASFNRQLVEASAAWDGFKQRIERKAMKVVLSDGSLKDTVAGFVDGTEHNDSAGWGHMIGLNDGPYEAAALRKMKADDKFKATLTPQEKANVGIGRMNDDLRNKYNAYYGQSLTDGWQLDKEMAQNPEYFKNLQDRANQLLWETQNATHPANLPEVGSQPVDPTAPSVVNNNPWNINFAGQPGAVKAGRFARFSTPADGVMAAYRQLMLYYSGKSQAANYVPQTSVEQIVSTASPESDGNPTPQMIDSVSKELHVAPNQTLDLGNLDVASKLLASVFHAEGNSPYTAEKIKSIIQQNPQQQPLPALPPFLYPPTPAQPGQPPQASPAPLVPPAGKEPLVNRPLLPAYSVPTAAAMNTQALTEAMSAALKDNGVKIELTVINSKTGQRSTFTGSGSKVSTAMQFPG